MILGVEPLLSLSPSQKEAHSFPSSSFLPSWHQMLAGKQAILQLDNFCKKTPCLKPGFRKNLKSFCATLAHHQACWDDFVHWRRQKKNRSPLVGGECSFCKSEMVSLLYGLSPMYMIGNQINPYTKAAVIHNPWINLHVSFSVHWGITFLFFRHILSNSGVA